MKYTPQIIEEMNSDPILEGNILSYTEEDGRSPGVKNYTVMINGTIELGHVSEMMDEAEIPEHLQKELEEAKVKSFYQKTLGDLHYHGLLKNEDTMKKYPKTLKRADM